MIPREAAQIIIKLRKQFPVITLTGPRQSGKTTLLKSVYTDLPYFSLEDIDVRNTAINDPRGFLSNFPEGAVLDEIQRVPALFSYIQGIIDNNKKLHFVLSGSQNFLLLENISQSLAGRAAILKLLPFSISELQNEKLVPDSYEQLIFTGMYPGIYDRDIDPEYFYPSYISTYIERDVRQIKNIENLNNFSNFLQLCAGRTGQVINLNSLATDAGISPNTAKSWLSILEASYIIYFLQPYYENFNKRIIKSPKLYFYDTGLVCSLLGISSVGQVKTFHSKGALFENLIITDLIKNKLHKGLNPRFYYWQNKTRQEIDLIIDNPEGPLPFEIKSGMTMNENYFTNLKYWQKLSDEKVENLNVIYGGDTSLKTSNGNYISWKKLHDQVI
ncbi:MAG: ATP-binding protein [Bacteroidales bacterium]|nr:ATP-binding protein [Bacteroidales bacterium]